ncbi:MAG: hypothetical protein Ta2D_12400 [Rickettsiales bacterium]|nr:MAG: hypothetical protein Ta2D_12400 [Rickettsiales bacterium]
MVETYHERRNCLKNKKRQKESEEYRKYTDTTKCIFGSPKTG